MEITSIYKPQYTACVWLANVRPHYPQLQLRMADVFAADLWPYSSRASPKSRKVEKPSDVMNSVLIVDRQAAKRMNVNVQQKTFDWDRWSAPKEKKTKYQDIWKGYPAVWWLTLSRLTRHKFQVYPALTLPLRSWTLRPQSWWMECPSGS